MAINKRDYSESEWNALERKMDYPNEKVICPRCGNEIVYTKINNSISVDCKTKNCIFGGIRGI